MRARAFAVALFLLLNAGRAGADGGNVSQWDQSLPRLTLSDVHVDASALPEAWQALALAHLTRCILVVDASDAPEGKFSFHAEKSTVAEVWQKLASTYGYRTTQDPATGVTWIHPASRGYDRLLSAKLNIRQAQIGLPMQSGILEAMQTAPDLGLAVKVWSEAFLNTFDYAVDLPAGVYTVRDLLNRIALANPTKSFLVHLSTTGKVAITAVNLASEDWIAPPAGALHWWRTEVRASFSGTAPSRDDILAALSSPEPGARRAARAYLEAILMRSPVDDWLAQAKDRDKALWLALAVLDVVVRTPPATETEALERLRKEWTPGFRDTGSPDLVLLSALEIARVGSDTGPLESLVNRKLTVPVTDGLLSDIARIVRRSELVRAFILKRGWAALLGRPLTELPDSAVGLGAKPQMLEFALE